VRVLLDENLPHDLTGALIGHSVSTVQGLGWASEAALSSRTHPVACHSGAGNQRAEGVELPRAIEPSVILAGVM
jgi:hypothetical protein